ncbi:MAG: hypothetical protein ACLP7Q_14135 [Isosphaeraceae bacterium]
MPDPILFAKAFAAAGALSLALTLLVGASPRAGIAAGGAVLAVVGAVYAGLWILGLLPHVPPREDLDRLLLVVLPGAAIAEAIAAASDRLGWVARVVVAALAAPVLLQGTVYVTDLSGPGSRAWSSAESWLIFAALAALLMAAWTVSNRLAARKGGLTALACVAEAILGAGLVTILSGYATGGQIGVPLAAGLGCVAIGSLVRSGKPDGRGALGVGVVGLFALLVIGRLFASLTTLNAALLFAAPLLGWLPEALPAGRRVRVALRLLLAAAPVVVALALAQHRFAADSARPASGVGGSSNDYMSFGK